MRVTCGFELGIIEYRSPAEIGLSEDSLFEDSEISETRSMWANVGNGDALAQLMLGGRLIASTTDLAPDVGSEMAEDGWPTFGLVNAHFTVADEKISEQQPLTFTAELRIRGRVFAANFVRIWEDFA